MQKKKVLLIIVLCVLLFIVWVSSIIILLSKEHTISTMAWEQDLEERAVIFLKEKLIASDSFSDKTNIQATEFKFLDYDQEIVDANQSKKDVDQICPCGEVQVTLKVSNNFLKMGGRKYVIRFVKDSTGNMELIGFL